MSHVILLVHLEGDVVRQETQPKLFGGREDIESPHLHSDLNLKDTGGHAINKIGRQAVRMTPPQKFGGHPFNMIKK